MSETVQCPHCKQQGIRVDSNGYLARHKKAPRPTAITCNGTGMSADIVRRARERSGPKQ